MKQRNKDQIIDRVIQSLKDETNFIICSADYKKENDYHKTQGWSEALLWVLGLEEKEEEEDG